MSCCVIQTVFCEKELQFIADNVTDSEDDDNESFQADLNSTSESNDSPDKYRSN